MDIVNWALFRDQIQDREYSALWINIDDLDTITKRNIPQVNQGKYAKSYFACTIVWTYIDLCYLWNKKSSEIEMLEFIDYCVTKWYKVWFGRWVDSWAKHTVDYWNSKYKDKLTSYVKIMETDPDFQKVIDKWYLLGCSYGGNDLYNYDYKIDCVLDGNTFGEQTYWHRTSIMKHDDKLFIEDSYAGNPYNEYEIKDLKWLLSNGVYRQWFYLFFPQVTNKQEISRLNKIRVALENIISNYIDLMMLSNDKKYIEKCKNNMESEKKKLQQVKDMLLKLN